MRPGDLRRLICIHARKTVLSHVCDALGDQVGMVLDGLKHVGQNARAGWTVHRKQVGEARHHQAQIALRAILPRVLKSDATGAGYIEGKQRSGDRIEAGGEHDQVEGIFLLGRLDPRLCDPLNRRFADVDQFNIVAVEGLIIIGVEAEPLGAERIAGGHQLLRHCRVADDAANLFLNVLGRRCIRLRIGEDIAEHRLHGKPAELPRLVELCAPLLRRYLHCRQSGIDARGHTASGHSGHLAMGRIVGAHPCFVVRISRTVIGRNRVICGSLENREMRRLLG